MEVPVIAVFVVVFGLAITGGFFALRAQQKRQAELKALAGELGLRIEPDNDRHDAEYEQFEIFRRGHSRSAQNTMRGEVELFGRRCKLQVGDFRYQVSRRTGKVTTTSTFRFSYLIVHPPWPSPKLLVRREGLFDKVKGALGFDDIDFESIEFSRRFFVQSNDKRFAYDVLHARMMEFLLAEPQPMLDLDGGALCISDGQHRWNAAAFRARIDFVRRFCELWPRHLVKDLET